MLPYTYDLQGYCEGCPYFDAEQMDIDVTTAEDKGRRVNHVIGCKNEQACKRTAKLVNGSSGV